MMGDTTNGHNATQLFAPARAIADAVLYEGYLLYPYTASARKNRVRWQFGVVVPRAYEATGTGENATQQTEVLLDIGNAPGAEASDELATQPQIDVLVRFLQVEARTIEAASGETFVPVPMLVVDGTQHVTFDETVERDVEFCVNPLRSEAAHVPVRFDGERSVETLYDAAGEIAGRVVRERWPLVGTLHVSASPIPNAPSLVRLRVVLENDSEVVASSERAAVLRTAFVSAHTLLAATDATFLSPIDPPAHASDATAALENRHTWPVLVGDEAHDPQRAALVLSSPIVLGDFPRVAPQTDSDAFDGTEIDELLTLGVLALSDAERAEARSTDPRARAIVDRAERFGSGDFARVHAGSMDAFDAPPPASVVVGGVALAKGSSVRLRPKRRADAWDTFLNGKTATVQKIHQDFEDKVYVAVTVDDDPASDLHEWYGRAFFFEPDEVEPVGSAL